nr:MAG TPA: hypothetical protein [Caudoviricetes sp.]
MYIVYPKEEGDRIGSLTLEIMKKTTIYYK